jgi:hypothetical protein
MSRLTEIGRAAMRAALLESCERHGWRLNLVAADLGMHCAGTVGTSLRTLAPDVYQAAKADGRIKQGHRHDRAARRRRDDDSPRT